MLNSYIYKCIECAIPHKCARDHKDEAKKCAYCEIGYKFIACKPFILQCGHNICEECKPKIDKRNIACKICDALMINTNTFRVASETFIKKYMGDLTKELKEKYLKGFEIYSGYNQAYYLI